MVYETVSGDTFDQIAKKTLGDEKAASKIMQANLEHINVIQFSAGNKLAIPEVSKVTSTKLPPWKSGDL